MKKQINDKLYVCEFRITAPSDEASFEAFSPFSEKFAIEKKINSLSFRVKFFCESENDRKKIKDSIKHNIFIIKNLGIYILSKKDYIIQKEDWTETWKKYFKITKLGYGLVLKPAWLKYKAKKNETVIEINPGMSFGTGKHQTTRFCLSEIARLRDKAQNQSFLDAGCGSGILSIAAAKLGYKPIFAFDNDSEAIKTAQENFERNSILPQFLTLSEICIENATKIKQKFDLIAANIISNVLIKNAHILKKLCSQNGKIILAGIPDSDTENVVSCFKDLKLLKKKSSQGWTGLTFKKTSSS